MADDAARHISQAKRFRRSLATGPTRSGRAECALPKSAHAKAALAEIYDAEDGDPAEQAAKAFAAAYGAKWPKAVAKVTNDLDVLLAFHDFPGEHWIHLRTTNPIERPAQPSGYGGRSPRDPARGLPGSRWRSNSSRRDSTLACHQFRPPRRAGQSGREVRERRPRRRPDESTCGDTHAA
jgi:hypothetical protein